MLGLGTLTRKVFGTPNDRKVKSVRPLVARINALEPEFQALSDDDLIARRYFEKLRLIYATRPSVLAETVRDRLFTQIETEVIQSYLPRQLDAAETNAAIDKAIADLGAESIRDMGRVMAELRTHYAGQMDFGAVGPVIKQRLMK